MSALVSAISGLADIWGKSASIDSANRANQIAEENYSSNSAIARKNLKLQQEQFDYQKILNATQMAREDSAYSRKVADLRSAGLNPALALSGGGMSTSPLRAGEAPQQQALERRYTPVDYRYPVGEAMERLFLLQAQEANISKTRSEQALLDARTINEINSAPKVRADAGLAEHILNISRQRGALPTDPLPLKLFDTGKGVLQTIQDYIADGWEKRNADNARGVTDRATKSQQFWSKEIKEQNKKFGR